MCVGKCIKIKNALPFIYTYKECIAEELFNQLNEMEKIEAASMYIALDKGCINPVSQIESGLMYELETRKKMTRQNALLNVMPEMMKYILKWDQRSFRVKLANIF